jgi:ABC-2 type transport system ATP-binding protein
MKFSEEMTSLTDRFREVEVTLTSTAAIQGGGQWPDSWLRREKSPAVIRFVESQFDSERTPKEIHRIFGDVVQVSVNPMALRAIFVALARTGSKVAA